jgi:tetratricopeptide (TPR) repeat protein
LGADYQGAIREGNKALALAKTGVGTGIEPSRFNETAKEILAERLERWNHLLKIEADEASLQQTAKAGKGREILRQSEQTIWKQGTRLFALLLLMEGDDAAKEESALAEGLLPPEMAAVWNAYKKTIPVDERVEQVYGRLTGDVVRLVGIQKVERLAAVAREFSEEGKVAAARVFMEAEAWRHAVPLLEGFSESASGEVFAMKGICFYHLGAWNDAKRCLLRAQELSPSAEASSYLRWIEEAAEDA